MRSSSATSPRRVAAGVLLSLAVLTAAACGDDDDDVTLDDVEAPADRGDHDDHDGGDLAGFTGDACDAFVALSGVMMGDPAEAPAVIDAFESSAPDFLAESARVVAAGFSDLLDGTDEMAFSNANFQSHFGEIANQYFDTCDIVDRLDVEGVDYGFEGIPAEVNAGRVAIAFANRTEDFEAHEMVIMKKRDGVTETIEELLELPEDEGMQKLQPIGVLFAEESNNSSYGMFDLEPGDYVAICFIPMGGHEDGAPHFAGGMVAEFEVK